MAGRSSGIPLLRDGRSLTARELEVLRLVAVGLSNNQIAAQLFLSINSVKTYIRQAYRKIGAATLVRLTAWKRGVEHSRLDEKVILRAWVGSRRG